MLRKDPVKIGDRVRITAVPLGLPDPQRDDLRTNEIFERCLGQIFPIVGFQGEWLELHVGEVMGVPAYTHSIWIEPDFVELVKDAEAGN